MRIKTILCSGFCCAAMIFMTLPASAAIHKQCTPRKATAASYTWNFPKEANSLFKDIEADARQAAKHSARLETYVDSPTLSWESHTYELMQVRAAVNDMGTKLCRLETIRRVLAPWQQKTVARIANNVVLMANNTGDAIRFVNGHHEELWLPVYQKYVTNLYNQSHALANSAGEAVQYASMHKEYRNLRHELGVGASS